MREYKKYIDIFKVKLEKLLGKQGKENLPYIFIAIVLILPIFYRVIPQFLIGLTFIISVIWFFVYDFYLFFLKIRKDLFKQDNFIEYSWGIVKKEDKINLNIKEIWNKIKHLEIKDLRDYLLFRKNVLIILAFVFADLFIALKNLNITLLGAYIGLSIFTKFVFLGYYFYIDKLNNLTDKKEDNILDIFYNYLNLFLTISAFLFVVFFLFSKFFINSFFGYEYYQHHTSLPFILLVNISLTILFVVYQTAKSIDNSETKKVLKIYAIFLIITTILINPNSLDLVTYFVIGMSNILSIFLYNIVIKKPLFLKENYNNLF